MDPIPPQSLIIDISITPLIIGIVIGIVGVIILPLLAIPATAIWIISMDIWRTMFKNRSRHLKREKLRKEWNKAARVEQHRQQTVKCIIKDNFDRKQMSEEMCFLLMELVSNRDVVLTSRKYIISDKIEANIKCYLDRKDILSGSEL
jgi:hypothetical protein